MHLSLSGGIAVSGSCRVWFDSRTHQLVFSWCSYRILCVEVSSLRVCDSVLLSISTTVGSVAVVFNYLYRP